MPTFVTVLICIASVIGVGILLWIVIAICKHSANKQEQKEREAKLKADQIEFQKLLDKKSNYDLVQFKHAFDYNSWQWTMICEELQKRHGYSA